MPKRIRLDFHKKYGHLILLTCLEGGSHTTWRCRCDCGKEVKVRAFDLNSGVTKSCGCLRKKTMSKTGKHNKTHGMRNTPEYAVWRAMKQRCNDPNHKDYKNYGGRGISICERWLNFFENFYSDMGEKPKPKRKYSIDRIDNEKGYYKENCR